METQTVKKSVKNVKVVALVRIATRVLFVRNVITVLTH